MPWQLNQSKDKPWGYEAQKLWNREHKPKPPQDETPQQKKQRQAQKRKAARQRPFAEKESYQNQFDLNKKLMSQRRLIVKVELLQVTYLHRTQPDAEASEILNSVQLQVLKAKARQKLPTILTVAWAVEAVAYLGGYLEHRRKTAIGIQVQERGWLKLHDLCEGWKLARNT